MIELGRKCWKSWALSLELLHTHEVMRVLNGSVEIMRISYYFPRSSDVEDKIGHLWFQPLLLYERYCAVHTEALVLHRACPTTKLSIRVFLSSQTIEEIDLDKVYW